MDLTFDHCLRFNFITVPCVVLFNKIAFSIIVLSKSYLLNWWLCMLNMNTRFCSAHFCRSSFSWLLGFGHYWLFFLILLQSCFLNLLFNKLEIIWWWWHLCLWGKLIWLCFHYHILYKLLMINNWLWLTTLKIFNFFL